MDKQTQKFIENIEKALKEIKEGKGLTKEEVFGKKQSLSDKMFNPNRGHSLRPVYHQKDVKQSLKELIKWCNSDDAYEDTGDEWEVRLRNKAKEIFGERLIV